MARHINRQLHRTGLLVGAMLLTTSFAAAQQEYLIVDLGPIAGVIAPADLQGAHLNNITMPGLDPSFSTPPVLSLTAFEGIGHLVAKFSFEGQILPLGTLGGDESVVHDMNYYPLDPLANVRFVGAAQDDNLFFHACIWDGIIAPADLGTLGGDESSAMAINDARQVVGWAQDAQGDVHATLWDGVIAPADLDALVGAVGPSCANDIDNYGHIVGQAEYTGKAQATAWVRDIAGIIAPADLGAMGGDESEALAVEANQTVDGVLPTQMIVAGWSEVTPGGARHAAFWDVDTITEVVGPMDLGTLGGTNAAALDVGFLNGYEGWPCRIVGTSDIAPPLSSQRLSRASGGGVTEHAFIWDSTNGMRDLNQLIDQNAGWELTRADSVNTSGMIAGIGQLNGNWHAFRLDPINTPQPCPADSDNDGLVGILDFLEVLAEWGACP